MATIENTQPLQKHSGNCQYFQKLEERKVESQTHLDQPQEDQIQLEQEQVNSSKTQSPIDDAPIKRTIKIDPRHISNLAQEQRQRIRQLHPEMNDYFTMSARDKSKHFHTMNQSYRQQIKLDEPPGSAPMKKTIRFKKRFQIRPFGYEDRCDHLTAKKSFMELYKAKDIRKSKKLGKFRKNL